MTATKTLTFEKVVAANSDTLNYLLDQDDVTALTPDDFVTALDDAADELSGSFEQTNQHNGEVLGAAATLLTEALGSEEGDPGTRVLLDRALKHLLNAEI
jgi:hypothetical protein